MTRRVFAALPLSAFLLAAAPKKNHSERQGRERRSDPGATSVYRPAGDQATGRFGLEATSSSPRSKSSRKYGKEIAVDPDDFCLDQQGRRAHPALRSQSGGRQERHDHHASQRDTDGRRASDRTDLRRHARARRRDRWGILRTASDGHRRLGRGSTPTRPPCMSRPMSRTTLEKALDRKMLPAKNPSSPSPACSASRWKSRK